MACSIFANGDSGMRSDNPYRNLGVGDYLPDLFPGFARGKHGKRGNKRPITIHGQSGGNPHHVRFRNPHVEETLREILGKEACLCRTGKIGGEDNDSFINLTKLGKCSSVGVACCFLAAKLHLGTPSQSLRNLSIPVSVSGWQNSFLSTSLGTVAISAPRRAASITCRGWRTLATITSVEKPYVW